MLDVLWWECYHYYYQPFIVGSVFFGLCFGWMIRTFYGWWFGRSEVWKLKFRKVKK